MVPEPDNTDADSSAGLPSTSRRSRAVRLVVCGLLVGGVLVAGFAALFAAGGPRTGRVAGSIGPSERLADKQPGDSRSGTGHVIPIHPVWVQVRDVDQLIQDSDLIVEVRVRDVRRGEPIVVAPPIPAVRERMPDVPTQRIGVEVLRTFAGVSVDRVTLFRTGGGRSDGAIVEADGDPSFESGQRYVLFLRRRSDGLYIYLGPSGRYRLGADGELRALAAGEVAAVLNGKKASELPDLIVHARGQEHD